MVKEIGMADVDLPEGYPGNMSDEQEKGLKELWQKFFECCEKASGSKKKGEGDGTTGDDAEENSDPKKANIPKGDEAKEEARKKEEEKAMNDLMKEYGGDALRESFWKFVKADDPDTIMLRFMRARKWDVSRAVAMLAGCLKWRLDNNVEELAEQGDLGNGPKIEKFMEQEHSGKAYALGTALNEQPICYIHVRKHFTNGQPGASMQKYVIYVMESFRMLMMPPNDKVTLLFDLTGFGLKNMDWSCILFILKCLEAYFPESLGILYIHNAPWIFSGIWKILSPMLDPVVRAKVAFTKGPNDMKDRIPAERLITDLGGNCTNDFIFVEPQDGENDIHKDSSEREKREKEYMDTAKEYEQVTADWAKKGDSATVDKRKLLVKKLRVAQFHMEPYTRGKTLYHRDGTLDGQGIVTWLYKQKDGEDIRHIVGRRHCVAVMEREIKEIEDGGKLADAEKKSDEALEKADYVTLYGSEELAQKIEGSRVQGKVPEAGTITQQTKEHGGVSDKADVKVAEGGAAGGAAAASSGGGGSNGAAVAPIETPSHEFKDAPEAKEKDAAKAVDGDAKVDEKADTAQGGGAHGIDAEAAANGNGDAEAEKENKADSGKANGAAAKKDQVAEKAKSAKSSLKGKFKGMMQKVN